MLLACAGLSSAEISADTLIRMGAMKTVPVIDGKISKTEWGDAAIFQGAISDRTAMTAARNCVFYFGYDDKNIYFALDSAAPTPPEKLTEKDTVTLWLQAPGAKTPRFWRFNQEGKGNLPASAKAACHVGNDLYRGITEQRWHAELSIPRSEVGELTGTWGLQMSREYQNVQETGYWHFRKEKPGEMGTFIPDPAAPIIAFVGIGNHYKITGNYHFVERIVNTTPKTVEVKNESIRMASATSFSVVDYSQTDDFVRKKNVFTMGRALYKVNPGELVFLDKVDWAQFPNVFRTFYINMTSPDGKTVFYRRSVSWDLGDPKRLTWAGKDIPKLQIAFFPSHSNKLYLRVVGTEALRKEPTGGGSRPRGYTITAELKDSAGRVLRTYAGIEKKPRFEVIEVLGEMPLGDYAVTMTAKDKDGKFFTDCRTFAIRRFPWQGNNIGKDRVIIPPFVPLKVEGTEVHALQTGYRIAKNGFWDRIYAKGDNILTAPVELRINGERFTPESVRMVSKAPERVVFESTASWKNLRLTVVQDYDYDGFCKTTLKFKPEGEVMVNSLTLSVPVREDIVKFVNAFNRQRSQPGKIACDVPAGKGIVWDVSQGNKNIHKKYGYRLPYLWIGEVYKGISWVADSFQHFSNLPEKPCQRLVRGNGAVTFQMDIVNKPVTWSAPRDIVMGFEPTPVKPQAAGYRKMSGIVSGNYWYPDNCQIWNMDDGDGTSLRQGLFNPPGGDYSFLKYVLSLRNIPPKKRDQADFERHVQEYYKKHIDEILDRNINTAHEWLSFNLRRYRYDCAGKVTLYIDPIAISCFWPEDEMYKAEWNQYGPYPFYEPFFSECHSILTPSRIDKLLWDEQRAVRFGYDGIYFDLFSMENNDSHNSEMNPECLDENGELIGAPGFLGWRELMKRTATMLYVNGRTLYGVPWVMNHTTMGNAIPVNSFASNILTWEHGGRRGDFQDRYAENEILADSLGTQDGCTSFILLNNLQDRNTPREKQVAKSATAILLGYALVNLEDQGFGFAENQFVCKVLNIIYDFGYGDPGVEIYPFWGDRPQPVTHDGKDVRMTVVRRRDGRTLLMLGNLGKAVTVNLKGIPADAKLFNPETGKPISGHQVKLDYHSYALVQY